MSESTTTGGLGAALCGLLRQPVRLRLALGAALLAAWYAGLYLPLEQQIGGASRRLAAEQEHMDLARQVEHLRRESQRYRKHLPEEGDDNEWINFLMAGIRERPLKVVALEPRPSAGVGPYKAVVLHVVVNGSYQDLAQFLRWLEGSPRLVRIEAVRITTTSGNGKAAPVYEMQLTVMGVVG